MTLLPIRAALRLKHRANAFSPSFPRKRESKPPFVLHWRQCRMFRRTLAFRT